MKLAILLLLALIGLVIGFLVYRALIHSARFAQLIGGAVEPPPETPDEVLRRLRTEKDHAGKCAERCKTAACKSCQAVADIQRELRPPRRKRSP